jgi:glycosyltransferase involved in cell wall biosynthesis
MNILFISAVLPYPLTSGGQIRMYQLLKRLSKKHSITLLSFIRGEKEKAYLKELSFLKRVETIHRGKALQLKYLIGALGNYSWLLSTYNNTEMRNLIRDHLATNEYDLIHIEPFYVYPSLPKTSVPIVTCEHNVEYAVYEQFVRKLSFAFFRPLLFLDVVKTRIWEESVWKKSNALIAVSEEDKTIMAPIRKREVAVVPNGVDCAHYTYTKRTITADSLQCLFIGDFAWMPNKEAVTTLLTSIWPAILKKYPKAKLTIVGKQFPKALISSVSPSVTRVEYVPDIRSVYDAHSVLLAPMGIGGGTKFKLLEAMASGLVVITSKEGRMGIRATPGEDVMEARTAEEYVAAIQTVCTDPKKVVAMTGNAREIIEKQYNWDTIAGLLDDVWRKTT